MPSTRPALNRFERQVVLFLLKHLAGGVVGALVMGGGILALDIAGLRTLALADDSGFIAVLMLFFGLTITLGSVAMGIGIMSLADD